MELQTVVKIEKPDFQIGYDSRMMLLGSCFVENIGAKLEYFRFPIDINPCGIVYNPMSVADTLNLVLTAKRFIPSDLIQNNGKWVSFSHHGHFSAPNLETCLENINKRLEEAIEHLKRTDILVITWGTAWVYRHRPSGQIVSNCHKFPANEFERFRLETEDIVQIYRDLLERVWAIRPQLKVMFTVSPIRHWKDGAHGNQLSKSVLLLAIDRLMAFSDKISYFPSYEVVMDELRDYRFYAEDMLHISSQGIDYIWQKFKDHYMTCETQSQMKQIEKWNKILLHRPDDPDSETTRQLRRQAEEELRKLEAGIKY